MAIPAYIKKYFWDIDVKKAKPKSHPEFYIKRILEMGDKRAVSWSERVFGVKKMAKVSKKANLSPKSKNFWNQIFN